MGAGSLMFSLQSHHPCALTGLGLLLFALAGCGTIAKDGPTGAEVRTAAEVHVSDPGRLSYALVKLSPLVLSKIQTEPQPTPHFSRLARYARAADSRVGPSDTISVSIFESGAGGLFIPAEAGARPGNFVQIPIQEVDRNGNISVPFGGTIRALGRTTREISRDIEEQLKSRAIEPQVIVTIGQRSSNAVSILGDVGTPSLIPLPPGGLRLLPALARSGGPRFAPYDTFVTLQRGGRSEQSLLSEILKDPAENVQLAPNDVVYVSNDPRIFLAFGATAAVGSTVSIGGSGVQSGRRLNFDAENLTLAEGLAKAGGLIPERADATSVFLFRYTRRDILERAGVDVSNVPSELVATVYIIDLSQAEGYFLANHFFMKHKDIIFASDSPSVDLLKFLAIVNGVTGTALNGVQLVNDIKTIGR